MASYSKINLLGYIGNDPEPISSAGGEGDPRGAKFSLAVNRVWTDAAGEKQEAVDWFNVVVWRQQLVQSVLNYLRRGRLVFVDGRPQMQQWADKEGVKRETLQVVANQVIFLDRPEPEPESEDEIDF